MTQMSQTKSMKQMAYEIKMKNDRGFVSAFFCDEISDINKSSDPYD